MSIGWQPIAPTGSVDSAGTPLDYGLEDVMPRGVCVPVRSTTGWPFMFQNIWTYQTSPDDP